MMGFSQVASRVGSRATSGHNFLVSRRLPHGHFITRPPNSPLTNLSSLRAYHTGPSNSNRISSPKALALGAVLVAGFASALYSRDEIRLDTSKTFNPDTDISWPEKAINNRKLTWKEVSTMSSHEGLGTSAKPPSDGILTHGTENRSYDALSPEQVTRHLKKNETSALVNKSGLFRYDTNQVACNEPLEDEYDELTVVNQSPVDGDISLKWGFWAIYDGHSGWATAAKLRHSLILQVYHDLKKLYQSSPILGGNHIEGSGPSNSDVDKTIQASFLALDHEIVWSHLDTVNKADSKALATKLLAPALSGSCALLAFYDATTQLLRVACTGDSRAVLGRRVNANTWAAIPLSSDQTGANPEEIARIRAEHPPEERDCVRNGRLLGYEPSRVFGDATLKWSREVALTIREKFYGKTPSEKVLTPPYATAEPVITTTKIHPEKGDFVVMACDGLWEMLSNEEVVALVAEWINRNDQPVTGHIKETKTWWDGFFGGSSKTTVVDKLPRIQHNPDKDMYGEPPVRPRQWQITRVPGAGRKFVVQDANVATHLIRNGLGGGDHDLISSLLMLQGKNARRFRDDLTVTVIFFGPEEDQKTE